jgi:hypothetical protein
MKGTAIEMVTVRSSLDIGAVYRTRARHANGGGGSS